MNKCFKHLIHKILIQLIIFSLIMGQPLFIQSSYAQMVMGGMGGMGGMGAMYAGPSMGVGMGMGMGMGMGGMGMGMGGMGGMGMAMGGMGMAGMGMMAISGEVMKRSAQSFLETDMYIQRARLEAERSKKLRLTVQDRQFPKCRTLPGKDDKPLEDMCRSIQTQGHLLSAEKIKVMAEKAAVGYDLIMSKGLQTGTDVGIQCIEEEGKRMMDKLNKEQEELKRLEAKMKNVIQKYENKQRSKLETVRTVHQELYGGGDQKTKDKIAKLFTNDRHCKVMMGTNLARQAVSAGQGQGGLVGIRSMVSQNFDASSQFMRESGGNAKLIEKLVKQDIDRLKKQNETGLTSTTTQLNFNVTTAIQTDVNNEVERDYKKLQTQLGRANIRMNLPPNALAYMQSKGDFDLPSKQYIKNDLVNTCMQDPTEVDPIDENLLGNIKQFNNNREVAGGAGPAAFVDEAQRLLDGRFTIDQKIERIKALEKEKGSEYRVKTRAYGNTYLSLSQILERGKAHCENWYEKRPIREGERGGLTRKDLVEESYRRLEKIDSTIKESSDILASKVMARIMKCEGVPVTPKTLDPQSCNAQTFSKQNPNFCVPNAKACAQSIQSCNKKVENYITKKENQLKNAAKNYNDGIEKLVQSQNNTLKKINGKLAKLSRLISKNFPGISFKTPPDMRMDLPPKQKGKLDVELYGDGQLNYSQQLTPKFQQLYQAMEQQKQQFDQSVQKRIADLTQQYQKEKQEWEQVKQRCDQGQQAYAQQLMAKQQQDAQMAIQERQQMNQLCAQMQNTMLQPGCSGQLGQMQGQMANLGPHFAFGNEHQMMGQMSEFCRNYGSQMGDQGTPNFVIQQLQGGQASIGNLCLQRGSSHDIFRDFEVEMNSKGFKFMETINQSMSLGGKTSPFASGDQAALQNFIKNGGQAMLNKGTYNGLSYSDLSRSASGGYVAAAAQLHALLMGAGNSPPAAAAGGSSQQGVGSLTAGGDLCNALIKGANSPALRQKCEGLQGDYMRGGAGQIGMVAALNQNNAGGNTGGGQGMMGNMASGIIKCQMDFFEADLAKDNYPLFIKTQQLRGLIMEMGGLLPRTQNEIFDLANRNMGRQTSMGCQMRNMMNRFTPIPRPPVGGAGGVGGVGTGAF